MAAAELQTRKFSEFSDKDLLMALRDGMEQERKAYGFSTTFDIGIMPATGSNFESVRDNMEKHQQALSMADNLREFLSNMPSEDDGLKDIDGTAEEVKE